MLVIHLFLAGLFAGGLLLMLLADGFGFVLGVSLLCLGTAIIGMLFPSYYEIGARTLLVRAGPLRWRIPLEAVQSVRPVQALPCLSAWSTRPLRVDYRDARGRAVYLMVAPVNRNDFLRQLESRSRLEPDPDGESLVKKEDPAWPDQRLSRP